METELPDRLKLPMRFDAAALAAEVASLDEGDWHRHIFRRNYEGDWCIVPLRAAAGETHPVRMICANPSQTEFVDTPMLDRLPAVKAALRRFRCPVLQARLMRLSPGSAILEHCDPDLDAGGGGARLHVPITTGQGVTFLLNRRPVPMAPGDLWYLRLLDPHSATNRGKTERVHLVVDVVMGDWLRGLMRDGLPTPAHPE
ncbi:MAG TPA: aspartyl/asparaginyl beta-hydroxylase domain-containing protein [Allosphingosinicella sp.]|nr:aspartyl/asparaginyl beta-hydroxylase domain-containing protein [Allosphingosinicella sp.]